MKKGRVLFCAAFFFLCAFGAAAQSLEILKDARIRAEPNDSADNTVIHARKGAIAPIVERNGLWYKVTYNGETGWIYSSLVREVPDRVKADEVFTKQDVSVLPPTLENEAAEAKVRYARVIKNNTQIRSHVDPFHEDVYIIHTVRSKDEVFILAGEGTSWCLVECKDTAGLAKCRRDTVGWVRCTDIQILDALPTKSAIVDEARNVFIGLGAGGVLVFIVIVIVTLRHIKAERRRNVYIQKNVLIIAKEPKMVQYTLTNALAPIERCFSELGFGVTLVKDSVVARNNIEHSMPDLILIDWNFETAIFAKIENLFARLATADKTYLLFFNVPDLSAAPVSKVLPKVSFLGITVSDRDIFKVVTPLLVHFEQQSAKDIQKSVQRCALEGEIDGGNLLEVLQFIEIGSKTGCLMVETKGPFGLVYFKDGMITFAAAAKGQGVEAVYAILNQPFGKFRFITNKQPKNANLNLPTLHVLMEWTKEKDEAGRR